MKFAPPPITQERLLGVIKELLKTNEIASRNLKIQEAGYAARAHARSLLDQAERERA